MQHGHVSCAHPARGVADACGRPAAALACHSAGPRRQPHAAPPLRCHAGVRLHRKLDLQMLSGLRRRQRRDAVELPLPVQPQDHRIQQSQILQPQAAHCQPRDRPHAARLCGRAQRHHRREKHRPAGGPPHRGIPDRASGQAGGHHHAVCEAARRHRGHAAREALRERRLRHGARLSGRRERRGHLLR